MSFFGDFDPEDAYDNDPPDPEQVAMKLVHFEGGRWDDYTSEDRKFRVQAIARLLETLRRQGTIQ
jgi:hypothetical protein